MQDPKKKYSEHWMRERVSLVHEPGERRVDAMQVRDRAWYPGDPGPDPRMLPN